MPWLLYRYILGEFLRVFLLSGGVLVTVIAFGAAIKPLAADELFGPAQTAKYIAFATVPMLQFALPFAAGFAATLVFHRLTNDNEIQAAAASGISYPRVLVPMFALGLVLVAIMVLLTQSIIPQFYAKMEQNISADIIRMFRASIEKGVPYKTGDMQIYADRIYELADPETGAQTRLILIGVAAAELDRITGACPPGRLGGPPSAWQLTGPAASRWLPRYIRRGGLGKRWWAIRPRYSGR